jgi:hypothetical protein
MANITAQKEVIWRAQIDEYAIVNLQRVTRLTDDEGQITERSWRRAITPDDDISNLATDLNISAGAASRLTDIITAARYPEAVQRFNDRKAAQTG